MQCLVWDHEEHSHWPFFFFFTESTIARITYQDTLQEYDLPQLSEGRIYPQDGAPSHFANDVLTFLVDHFTAGWIWKESKFVACLPPPLPRSPDFFMWGFVKDQVMLYLIQHNLLVSLHNLEDLCNGICAAVSSMTPQMLFQHVV